MLSFEELGFKVGSFFFLVTTVHFQLQLGMEVLNLAKLLSGLELKMNVYTQ